VVGLGRFELPTHGLGNHLPVLLSLPARQEGVKANQHRYPLHFPLHGLKRRFDRLPKLLKVMVGPWGLEPQTSTVSKTEGEHSVTYDRNKLLNLAVDVDPL
jgi:hypothetical protein